MLEIVLGIALAGACTAVALRHRRALSRGPSGRSRELAKRLRRTRPEDRTKALLELTTVSTWEGRLAQALSSATCRAEQVDAVSEAVNDLALAFGARARWSSTALRLQLLGAGLLCATGLIRSNLLGAFGALASGLIGAVVVAAIRRPLAAQEAEQRRLVDDWVGLLLPDEAAPEAPRRRRRA